MTTPVSPGSIPPTWLSQTPQEQEKISELRFQTALIRAFVSITGQNGSLSNEIQALEKGLDGGKFSDQLAGGVNQLISMVNETLPDDKPPFPSFSFSTEGSSSLAVRKFAISLQKLLNTAAEKGEISWASEQNHFSQLSDLVNNVGEIEPSAAFNKLNGVIMEANSELPSSYQLPTISFVLGG